MTESIYGIEPDQIESVVRKIKNERDNYAKMDVFDQYDVDWGDRKKALWELVRQGHYDAWNDPAIWNELTESIELASAEDLVSFLANVEHFDAQPDEAPDAGADETGYEDAYEDEYYEEEYYDDYDDYGGGYVEPPFESQRLVSFWPVPLDVMAMNAYAADADLVESRIEDFQPDVQKGLQLVRRRFGVIERDELPEGLVAELAKTRVWKSLPWYAWDVVDGELTKLEIGRQDGDGPAMMQQFLSNFVDEEAWAQAILDAIMLEDYGPNFSATKEAWPIADLEQIEKMVGRISIYNQDRATAYDLMLGRDDAPADLLAMAKRLDNDLRWHQAEFVAVVAALRAKERGEEAPEKALELISFRSIDSPSNREGFFSLHRLIDALHTYDEADVIDRFNAVFDGEYTKSEPFPALKAYPHDEALLQKAFEVLDVIAAGDNISFYGMNKQAFGFGMLGPDALPALVAALEATDVPGARNVYRRAILGIAADADGPLDESYDQYITLVDFEDAKESDVANYVGEDYRVAIGKLPAKRAAARIAADLDTDNDHWQRGFAALRQVPQPELLDRAFGLVANNGVPPKNGHDWLAPLFYDYEFRTTLEPYVGPALAATESPDFHNLVQNQFGQEKYDEMLAAAGGESAADKGPADKIRRLANELFESRPNLERTVIYAFTRADDAPEEGTLNRLGGRPFGIDADSWPKKDGDDDSPMEHIFTLDLDTVPALKARYQDDIRAISLFVRNPGHNNAWSPNNGDAEVVYVRDNTDEYSGDLPTGGDNAVAFTVDEIEVPFEAWTVGYREDQQMEAMKSAIYSLNAWVGGGGPMWLQSEEYFGMPVMQFDEGFAWGMNLGDCGIMYVFPDTAFWQCH